MRRCAVYGLGKVGSPLAAVLARAGYGVTGVDLDRRCVDSVNAGRAPNGEPGLQDALDQAIGRISATVDGSDAASGTDLSFVIVPTPSDENGRFVNDYVVAAVESIGRALRETDGYHVVAITSTVMPGSTGGPIREALERSSGRRVGEDVGLCYSPRFIALGAVVHDLEHPDLVLIGESDTRAGDLVEETYRRTCRSDPAIHRTSWVNAEIAKLAVNTFVTTKISFANMLAEICDGFPGADVDAVTEAVGADSRIGRKYLRGATGYGGPCFPRDNLALSRAAEDAGTTASIAIATDEVNRRQVDRLVDLVRRHLPDGGTAAVLGLAYKPDTPVIEASPGADLVARLAAAGVHVTAYDPLASLGVGSPNGGVEAGSLMECVELADVVVITTPWPEFARVGTELAPKKGRELVVIDCWRQIDQSSAASSVRIIRVGQRG